MKIKKIDITPKLLRQIIFIALLVAWQFIPGEVFAVILAVICFYELIRRRFKISKAWIIFIPLLIILFIGVVSGFSYLISDTWAYFRDIFYYANIVIYLLFAFSGFFRLFSRQDVFLCVYVAGTILSIYFLVRFVINISTNESLDSLMYLRRGNAFLDSSVIVFAAFVGIFYFKKSPLYSVMMVLNIVAFITMFSRTCVMLFAILVVFKIIKNIAYPDIRVKERPQPLGLNRFKPYYAIIIVLFVIFIVSICCLAFRDLLQLFVEKMLSSFAELSPNHEWTWSNVNHYWRGYETHQALKTFSEYSAVNKLFGAGFGSRMPLDLSINLGGELMSSIPILHNGYTGTLVKCGLFGLISYIAFIVISVVYTVIKVKDKDHKSLLLSLSVYMAVSSIFGSALMGNSVDFVIFILFGYLIQRSSDVEINGIKDAYGQ